LTRLLVAAALAVASLLIIFFIPPAEARPRYRQNLKKHYGDLLPRALDACTTCHVRKEEAPDPDAFERKPPHNSFGARLRELGKELRAEGKPADMFARLKLVAAEDADGDGAPNELEVLAGHAPGQPDDAPAPDELSAAAEKQRVLAERLAGYAWEPFRPVARPAVPEVRNAAWVRNPIDAFIAAEHEKRGLSPRPEAPRTVLLRRLYLDLIGLPPRPEELRAFLDDPAPDAYEAAAGRLLASPQHGERWGRHWMDVWRYSDWAGWGNQVRDSQPHIWRWRDWIIDSLNADKGYDRMLLEMLAGDELAPLDRDTLRATGYLARCFKLLSREAWMQETVDHVGQAFLGLTVGCARCHDHMYDPLSQEEYYRLRAVFEPHHVRLDRVPGQPDPAKDGLPRVFDSNLEVPTYLFERGDDRRPVKDRPLEPAVPACLSGPGFPEFRVEPVPLPLEVRTPEKTAFVVEETRAAAARAIAEAKKAFKAAFLKSVRAEEAVRAAEGEARAKAESEARVARDDATLCELDVPLAEARLTALEATLKVEQLEDRGVRERDPAIWKPAAIDATAAQRWLGLLEARRALAGASVAIERARAAAEAARNGDAKKAAAEKAAAELKVAEGKLAEAEKKLAEAKAKSVLESSEEYSRRDLKTYPAASSGRRLALARWIADRRHPLTARVAANHIWLRHFGQALVPSVADYGANGRAPSHPALLDWLAAELMEPSDGRSAPWSMRHIHRLIVTSSTYRIASTPDPGCLATDPDNRWLWRMSPRRLEAEAVRDSVLHVAGQLDAALGGPEIDQQLALSTHRRSIYYRNAAEKQAEFLKLFDMAAPGECYERKVSIVPQQALALANSELTLVMARLLARDLCAIHGSDPARFTSAAFERVLVRPPSSAELGVAAGFLAEQERLLGAAREKLVVFAADGSDGKKPSADLALRARENLVHALMNHHEFVTVR
jgi:hypothetical protein